jgi:hypothetical protein
VGSRVAVRGEAGGSAGGGIAKMLRDPPVRGYGGPVCLVDGEIQACLFVLFFFCAV